MVLRVLVMSNPRFSVPL